MRPLSKNTIEEGQTIINFEVNEDSTATTALTLERKQDQVAFPIC